MMATCLLLLQPEFPILLILPVTLKMYQLDRNILQLCCSLCAVMLDIWMDGIFIVRYPVQMP